MAWIELHEELPSHPKTKKLARILGIPLVAAIGHLVSLFTWALKHAQDGVISRYESPEIADGALWEGDPEVLMAALSDAGWTDVTGNGTEIHDWMEYAGKLIERRKQDAERKKAGRSPDVRKVSGGRPPDIQGTSEGNPNVSSVTVPYRTVPNQTVPYQGDDGARAPETQSDPPAEPPAVHPEANRLCQLLADLIEANGSKRPNVIPSWLQEVDRMIRIDKRAPLDIEGAIRWAQGDPFWRANILSPKKLREKFDTLRLQSQRGSPGAVKTKAQARFEAEMAELMEEGA